MANEYDAEDDRNLENLEGPGLRWMSIVVVILVVIGFFSLAWYAYHTSQQPLASGESDTIQADGEPYKEKPQQPGGMEIEHQDATVYDMISENGEKKDEKVEQLLPEAEEPMVTRDAEEKPVPKEVSDWMKKQSETAEAASGSEEEAAKSVEAEKPVQETEAKPVAPIKETVKEKTPAKVEKPAPVKPKPVVAQKPAAIAPASGGSAQVQIAALKSQAEAEAMWKTLSSKNDVLKGKSHAVVKADLGDKGVFYRLRVTGLADKAAAAKLCSSLQSRGVGCMPVN